MYTRTGGRGVRQMWTDVEKWGWGEDKGGQKSLEICGHPLLIASNRSFSANMINRLETHRI